MKFIYPVKVVPGTTLVSGLMAESEAGQWSKTTAYSVAANAIYDHVIYEALTANTGVQPDANPADWSPVGPTNAWAMFDPIRSTATQATGSIALQFLMDGVDSMSILDVKGESIHITVTDGAATLYDRTATLTAEGGSLFLADLPGGTARTINVNVTGPADVQIGSLQLGHLFTVGETLYGLGLSMTDFSKKTTDEFGQQTLIRRGFSRQMTAQVRVPKANVDAAVTALAAIRATPVVWIGAYDYASTFVIGFYKDWDVSISYPLVSDCNITIEGITENDEFTFEALGDGGAIEGGGVIGNVGYSVGIAGTSGGTPQPVVGWPGLLMQFSGDLVDQARSRTAYPLPSIYGSTTPILTPDFVTRTPYVLSGSTRVEGAARTMLSTTRYSPTGLGDEAIFGGIEVTSELADFVFAGDFTVQATLDAYLFDGDSGGSEIVIAAARTDAGDLWSLALRWESGSVRRAEWRRGTTVVVSAVIPYSGYAIGLTNGADEAHLPLRTLSVVRSGGTTAIFENAALRASAADAGAYSVPAGQVMARLVLAERPGPWSGSPVAMFIDAIRIVPTALIAWSGGVSTAGGQAFYLREAPVWPSAQPTAPGSPPTATADTATTAYNTAVTVAVRANDTTSGTLTVVSVTQPSHGVVTIDGTSGNPVYTPTTGYSGADSFSYVVSDGQGGYAQGTVSITVQSPPLAALVAQSDTASVAYNYTGGVIIPVRSNDTGTGALTVTAVTGAAKGTVTIDASSGNPKYVPGTGQKGTDLFAYSITDGVSTATAMVTVTIVTPPIDAVNDNYSSIFRDTPTVLAVRSNDVTVNTPITVASVTQPAHGAVVIDSATGNPKYTPTTGYSGTDSFTYTATDAAGTSDTATVNLTVLTYQDPGWANTRALIRNAADLSTFARAVTVTGDVATTGGPSHGAGTSMLFGASAGVGKVASSWTYGAAYASMLYLDIWIRPDASTMTNGALLATIATLNVYITAAGKLKGGANTGATTITADAWHLVTAYFSYGTVYVYLDGVQQLTVALGSSSMTPGAVSVGGSDATAPIGYVGAIDEFRVTTDYSRVPANTFATGARFLT